MDPNPSPLKRSRTGASLAWDARVPLLRDARVRLAVLLQFDTYKALAEQLAFLKIIAQSEFNSSEDLFNHLHEKRVAASDIDRALKEIGLQRAALLIEDPCAGFASVLAVYEEVQPWISVSTLKALETVLRSTREFECFDRLLSEQRGANEELQHLALLVACLRYLYDDLAEPISNVLEKMGKPSALPASAPRIWYLSSLMPGQQRAQIMKSLLLSGGDDTTPKVLITSRFLDEGVTKLLEASHVKLVKLSGSEEPLPEFRLGDPADALIAEVGNVKDPAVAAHLQKLLNPDDGESPPRGSSQQANGVEITVQYVSLQNFGSFRASKPVKVELASRGLAIVSGRANDLFSNGIGKTTLNVSAFLWCLTGFLDKRAGHGKQGPVTSLPDLKALWADSAHAESWVEVVVSCSSHSITVRRSIVRRAARSNSSKYKYDSQLTATVLSLEVVDTTRFEQFEAQREVEDMFGFPRDTNDINSERLHKLLLKTVVWTPFSSESLLTETQRSEFISHLSAHWSGFLSKLSVSITNQERAVSEAAKQRSIREATECLLRGAVSADRERIVQQIAYVKEQQAICKIMLQLVPDVSSFVDTATKCHEKADAEHAQAVSDCKDLQCALQTLHDKTEHNRKLLQQIEESLEPETRECEICSAPTNYYSRTAEARKVELRSLLTEQQRQIESMRTEIATSRSAIAELALQCHIAAARVETAKLDEDRRRAIFAELRGYSDKETSLAASLECLSSEVIWKESVRALETAQTDFSNSEKLLQDVKKANSELEAIEKKWWHQTNRHIVTATNDWLRRFAGCAVSASALADDHNHQMHFKFSIRTMPKSEARTNIIKAKVGILFAQGEQQEPQDVSCLSFSEYSRLRLALFLACSEVVEHCRGVRTTLRLIDECFAGLDEVSIFSVCEALGQYARPGSDTSLKRTVALSSALNPHQLFGFSFDDRILIDDDSSVLQQPVPRHCGAPPGVRATALEEPETVPLLLASHENCQTGTPKAEVDKIYAAVQKHIPLLRLVFVSSWSEVITRVSEHTPRIVHFICHGTQAIQTPTASDTAKLMIGNERITGEEIARALNGQDIEALLLMSCHSSELSLFRFDVPYIVVCDGILHVSFAEAFTTTFYAALSQGIDAAIRASLRLNVNVTNRKIRAFAHGKEIVN